MSFIKLTKTDGSLLVNLFDETVDTASTDLTLLGNNATEYGRYVNENFVRLLENFSSRSPQSRPLTGQLWFDKADKRLKVYDSTAFAVVGAALVSPARPVKLSAGDIWINNADNQLFFYDGTDLTLAGPIYKNSQGTSGFTTDTIVDTLQLPHTVIKLWNGGTLVGIFSKDDSAFSPLESIAGFSSEIKPGFNQSSISDFRFNAVGNSADAILSSTGVRKFVSSFMRTDTDTSTVGTLSIINDRPLLLGPRQNSEIRLLNDSLVFVSNSELQKFVLSTSNSALVITPDGKIGVNTLAPTESIDVESDANIRGVLSVDSGVISPPLDLFKLGSLYTKLNSNEINVELAGIEIYRDTSPARIVWRDTTDNALPGEPVSLDDSVLGNGTGYWVTSDKQSSYRTLTEKDLTKFSKSGHIRDLVVDSDAELFVWNTDAIETTQGGYNWQHGISIFTSRNVSIGSSEQDNSTLEVTGATYAKAFIEVPVILADTKFDITSSNYVVLNVVEDSIIEFIDSSSQAKVFQFIIKLINDTDTNISLEWPANIRWSTRVQPKSPRFSTQIFGFKTSDSGTTWIAFPIWAPVSTHIDVLTPEPVWPVPPAFITYRKTPPTLP